MDFLTTMSKPGAAELSSALLAIGLAFVLAQLISGVYLFTFRGMSYSRSFVQAIPLGAVVAAMLMLAVGESIAAGIGLAGGLSIIRFRTTMRDPRDMMFVFAGLGVGIACGLQAFPSAIGGTGVFCVSSMLLSLVAYGSQQQFDGLLRLTAPSNEDLRVRMTALLKEHTSHFALVTLREAAQGDVFEHAWQVRMPSPDSRTKLLEELDKLPEIHDLALHLQDPTLEV